MANLILLSEFQKTQIELWRVVEEAPDYEVSNLGRVRSYRGYACLGYGRGCVTQRRSVPRLLKHYTSRPYDTVSIQALVGEKTFLVHRLVALTFLPNPDNLPEVNHKNALKRDNRVENLEWTDHAGNHDHATRYGLRQSGEKHWSARLTMEQARWARQQYVQGQRPVDIARDLNVHSDVVIRIIHNRTYAESSNG